MIRIKIGEHALSKGKLIVLELFRAVKSFRLDGRNRGLSALSGSVSLVPSLIEQRIQVLDDMGKKVIGARWDVDLSRACWKLSSGVVHVYSEADVERAIRLRAGKIQGPSTS